MSEGRRWWMWAGVLGAVCVGLGAFGAHGLKERLTPEALAVWEVGARYGMYHALALLGVAAAADRGATRALRGAGTCFVIGTLIFTGTLSVLAVTGIKWLGAITPIGGIFQIVGWVLLAVGAGRRSE